MTPEEKTKLDELLKQNTEMLDALIGVRQYLAAGVLTSKTPKADNSAIGLLDKLIYKVTGAK